MYGLPPDFDPAPFVGTRLEVLCFAAYSARFYFDPEIEVLAESSFALAADASAARERYEIPTENGKVLNLLGQKVAEASANVDGTLTLTFESGNILQFVDDKPMYECYKISIAARDIIV